MVEWTGRTGGIRGLKVGGERGRAEMTDNWVEMTET